MSVQKVVSEFAGISKSRKRWLATSTAICGAVDVVVDLLVVREARAVDRRRAAAARPPSTSGACPGSPDPPGAGGRRSAACRPRRPAAGRCATSTRCCRSPAGARPPSCRGAAASGERGGQATIASSSDPSELRMVMLSTRRPENCGLHEVRQHTRTVASPLTPYGTRERVVESDRRHLYRRQPRGAAALVARALAQRALPEHPARHPGRQPDRRLHRRSGGGGVRHLHAPCHRSGGCSSSPASAGG